MTNPIIERIQRESGIPNLLQVLSEQLNPSDLQSLLLEVYRARARRQKPVDLVKQHETNRFVRPSSVDPRVLMEFDRVAFHTAAPLFEPVELAPVCPLGTTSALTPVDQNSALATARNSELVSDSTNVLALECAVRRKKLQAGEQKDRRVRLCTSHRLLRGQNYNQPNLLAHFRLFALCSAGRDEGSYRFELESLAEHIRFYLRLFGALAELGFGFQTLQVRLTDFAGEARRAALQAQVVTPLAARFPGVDFIFYPERESGRGYYDDLCFYIYARDAQGAEIQLADGGSTDWTRQLLGNKKERLTISGIGTERVCALFGPARFSFE